MAAVGALNGSEVCCICPHAKPINHCHVKTDDKANADKLIRISKPTGTEPQLG